MCLIYRNAKNYKGGNIMKAIKELVLSAKNGNKKHLISCMSLHIMMCGTTAFLCSKMKKTQKT